MIVNLDYLKNSEKGEFLIPDINYNDSMPELYREKFTTRALIKNILNHSTSNLIDSVFDVDYNLKTDIELIGYLENIINQKIKNYLITNDENLLISIFNSIQIWGGNSARMFYFKNGFEKNFNLNSYKEAVLILRSGKKDSFLNAIESFKKMQKINIAYASKHFSFWTSDLIGFEYKYPQQLPILDRLINNLVYGKSNQPDYRHYKKYVNDMFEISNYLKIDIQIIERNLFNFADTEEGKNWIKIRLNK